MQLKRPVTLIGLMGAGKTTIGIALASKLGVPFIDSDREIEGQAGATISEIFERDGEEFFRKVEAKTIETILSRGEAVVLATGGGAFINERARAAIKSNSTAVWLRADLPTLLERVELNNARPLLNNVDKKQKLSELIDKRYPIYAEADIIVDTDVNSRTIVINEIIRELSEKAKG